jgi:lipoyl(octanoyl) transferase
MLVAEKIVTKNLGRVDYLPTLEKMRAFTAQRDAHTPDEFWLLEHSPVYTLGLAANPAHGPRVERGIPVVRAERGGEITYHGPGQAVLYTLVDLARRGIKVKQFVALLEQAVIELLDGRGERSAGRATRSEGRAERRQIRAHRVAGAPGVYVDGAKIAALGIRVSRGCAFHGIALNVDMDLAPFSAIDPCGYPGLRVTQTRDLGIVENTATLGGELARILVRKLEHA